MTWQHIAALVSALAEVVIIRHAYGMAQPWPRYRHGPGHIDLRRPISARWSIVAVVLGIVNVWVWWVT